MYVYRDFHADLYPDTAGYTTELTAIQWMQGKNIPVNKISLDPAKRETGEQPITVRLFLFCIYLYTFIILNY